jgi:hypothetical protein
MPARQTDSQGSRGTWHIPLLPRFVWRPRGQGKQGVGDGDVHTYLRCSRSGTGVPHTQIVQEIGRIEIDAAARSLVWVDDSLYDVAAGWRRFPLDGSAPNARYSAYGPGFDAAVTSPARDLVALVQTASTKGLILAADTHLLRELNRSFYHAEAYRYPVALFGLPDGRTGLVHCPAHYNQLEIEDAASGEPLTGHAKRTPADVFHSRLAVSKSSRYLLSAGWVWQPWSCLMVYDLAAALDNPNRLDSYGDVFDMRGLIQAEISGACFAGDDVVLSTSPEPNDPDGPDDLAPNMLARWSTTDRRFVWKRRLPQTAGDLHPLADGVLGLCQHPRLYDASTGELVHEWPDLPTGTADSSIVWNKTFSGPARIAIDERNNRFAVTDGHQITVITWS